MKGFLIMVNAVKSQNLITNKAYLAWKAKYPDEFKKLFKNKDAWFIFRLAVSKAIGRGLYFNPYRFNQGMKVITLRDPKSRYVYYLKKEKL